MFDFSERYISVHFPLQRQRLCTVRRSKIVVVVLALVSLVLYSYGTFTTGVTEFMGIRMCTPFPHYTYFIKVVQNVDTVLCLIIPFIVILVLNIRIAHSVTVFYRTRRRMTCHTATNSSRRSSARQPQHSRYTNPNYRQSHVYNNGNHGSEVGGSRTQVRVTKMLLATSSIFLLLNLPRHCVRIYAFVQKGKLPLNFAIWHKLFQILYYIHFAGNSLDQTFLPADKEIAAGSTTGIGDKNS